MKSSVMEEEDNDFGELYGDVLAPSSSSLSSLPNNPSLNFIYHTVETNPNQLNHVSDYHHSPSNVHINHADTVLPSNLNNEVERVEQEDENHEQEEHLEVIESRVLNDDDPGLDTDSNVNWVVKINAGFSIPSAEHVKDNFFTDDSVFDLGVVLKQHEMQSSGLSVERMEMDTDLDVFKVLGTAGEGLLDDKSAENVKTSVGIDELDQWIPNLYGGGDGSAAVNMAGSDAKKNCGNGEECDEDGESEDDLNIIVNDEDMRGEVSSTLVPNPIPLANDLPCLEGESEEMGEAELGELGDAIGSKVGIPDYAYDSFFKCLQPTPGSMPEKAPTGPIASTHGNSYSENGLGTRLVFQLPYHKKIFDVNIDDFEEKPWRHFDVDMSNFFNYGLDEEKWKSYCKQMELLVEKSLQSRVTIHGSGKSGKQTDSMILVEVCDDTQERHPSIYTQNQELRESDTILEDPVEHSSLKMEAISEDLELEGTQSSTAYKNINGDGIQPFPLDGSFEHCPDIEMPFPNSGILQERRWSQHLPNGSFFGTEQFNDEDPSKNAYGMNLYGFRKPTLRKRVRNNKTKLPLGFESTNKSNVKESYGNEDVYLPSRRKLRSQKWRNSDNSLSRGKRVSDDTLTDHCERLYIPRASNYCSHRSRGKDEFWHQRSSDRSTVNERLKDQIIGECRQKRLPQKHRDVWQRLKNPLENNTEGNITLRRDTKGFELISQITEQSTYRSCGDKKAIWKGSNKYENNNSSAERSDSSKHVFSSYSVPFTNNDDDRDILDKGCPFRNHSGDIASNQKHDRRRGRSKQERWRIHDELDEEVVMSLDSPEAEEAVPDTTKRESAIDVPVGEDAEKLKMRSERFERSMPTIQDISGTKSVEIEVMPSIQKDNAEDAEIIHQRPVRKRKWGKQID